MIFLYIWFPLNQKAMGMFSSKTKKLIDEFKQKSQHYCDDLSKEINEMLEDLKSEYDENSEVLPEFAEFVNELKGKLDPSDSKKLEEFSSRLASVNRSARKGVDAMWELSKNQRKLTAENLRDFAEMENI